MKKGLRWKILLTLGIVGLALFLAYPPGKKINRGLDLRGGIHLVLQVITDDAINIDTDEEINRLRDQFQKKSLASTSIVKGKIGQITIQGTSPDQEGAVRDVLDADFRNWEYAFVGATATLTMKPEVQMYLRDQAVNQALETIRNRVDELGVSEPTIQRQGLSGNQIILELPGVDNPEHVKNLIKTTAVLEWKLVKAGPAPDEQTLLSSFGGTVPEDAQIIRGDPKRTSGGYYLVERVATVTGKDLRVVRRATDEWNSPAVSFSLNPEGGRRFERVTGENVGKQIAIVLDNKVISSPNVEGVIPANSGGIIRGRFTIDEAEDLVVLLRAGALPAGIKYLEERTVGPSLGADSIRKGLSAGVAAVLLVMAFMVLYYRMAGVNAITALILNMILLFGALAYFRAALTLPGIAGIILTIGMAVDANVLIFERIREELLAGKSVLNSIATGFARAFSAIFDSNLTTIISAIFLFQFGTGPVKGYAITLIIGITASMFTAVFVSRLIFDLTVAGKKRKEKMSI
jgi:preprotein translocase subunit SecD